MTAKRVSRKSGSNGTAKITSNDERKQEALAFNRMCKIVENAQFSRTQLMDRIFDPRRSINDECGYPNTENITIQEYKDMYDREAVATRVVEVFPQESWLVQPEVFETEDGRETEFKKTWNSLGSQLRGTEWFKSEQGSLIWEYLLRVDKLSGVVSFGIILVGIDDGLELSEEAVFGNQKRELTFLRVFDQSLVQITAYETDIKNPRFGQPTQYNVTFAVPTENTSMETKQVHWTRIIHVADDKNSSEIFAVPRQRPVWNRLLDVRKLYGGSAEMYWKGAFMGLSFETHPQLGGDVPAMQDPTFIADLKGQIENYENGLQRYLSTMGINVKTLAPQVVDPTPQIDAQIKAICIQKGIPKRIFEGSERGELASSQDSRAWHSRLKKRQNDYITPGIVVPFTDRLILLGVLPQPKEYFVKWPDLDTLTEEEQASVALKRTEAMAKYVQGSVESIVPPFDFFTRILGMKEEEVESMIAEAMKAVAGDNTMTGFDDVDETKIPPNAGGDSKKNG